MVPRKTTKAQPKRTRVAKNAEVAHQAERGKNGATADAASGNGHRPSFSEVQLRAYEIFVARGGTHGQDLADWFTAERELNPGAES
jgi:Protein of unknown function (DUF2934)